MKLSIIVPIYNVAPWIEGCILSIIAQTRHDFELILVDDCSPDNSVKLAEKILQDNSADFDVIILHHEQNKGLSAARNTGISSAKGDYLIFLDSDDQLPSQSVELLLTKAEETDAEVIIGEFEMGGTSSGVWPLKYLSEECKGRDTIMENYLAQRWYSMACNKMIRADFLHKHNLFFDENLKIHEDGIWNFKVFCRTAHIAFVHQPTYIYQVRENSIQTDKNLQRHFDACIQVQSLIHDEALCFGIANMDIYKKWQEKIKVWIYKSFVEPQHNSTSEIQFYRFVRDVAPNPRMTISHFHYYVWPYSLGMWLYKKTVGHLWAYE